MTKTTNEKLILNALIQNGKFCKVQYRDNDGNLSAAHGRTGVTKYKRTGKLELNDERYITFYDLSTGYVSVPKNSIVSVNGLNLRVAHR